MENRSQDSKKMTPEQIFNMIRILLVILLIVGAFALGEELHGSDATTKNKDVARETTVVEQDNNQEYLEDKNNIGSIRIETLPILEDLPKGEYQAVLSVIDMQGNTIENYPITLVFEGESDAEFMEKYDLTIVERIDK